MELVWISNIQLVLFKLSEKKNRKPHKRESKDQELLGCNTQVYMVSSLLVILFQMIILVSCFKMLQY